MDTFTLEVSSVVAAVATIMAMPGMIIVMDIIISIQRKQKRRLTTHHSKKTS